MQKGSITSVEDCADDTDDEHPPDCHDCEHCRKEFVGFHVISSVGERIILGSGWVVKSALTGSRTQ